MTTDTLTVLSAFSGVGGLDLGLEAAGFEMLGCIENDPIARRSLELNRKDWWVLDPPDIEGVAATLRPPDLGLARGQLTLLCGAPPCQPYSKAAMWKDEAWVGFADDRAKPLLSFLQLAEEFCPEAVLMENVQGFVAGPHSVARFIQRSFDEINGRTGFRYRVSTAVLDAANFGVPQRRSRAIVVALRDGAKMSWPVPTHLDEPTTAWDALHDVPTAEAVPATGRWADLLPSIPEGANYLWHTPKGGGMPLFGYRTRFWSFLLKLAKDRPSWTLPAQPGPSVGPFHWDNRPLTPTEALRIQSFPLDWRVEGTRREKVRQIGNATPPLLAEVLGKSLRWTLHGTSFREAPTFRVKRAAATPPPARISPVPAQFHALRGEHPDHPGAGAGPQPRSR